MSGTDSSALRDRARGCLLGLACGDALGGPLEFMDEREIQRVHGTVRDFIGGGWLSLRPGETTDDTAMALDLARSLAVSGRVDPVDIASRWVRWMQSNPKDIGGTTREALGYIADGAPWEEAGDLVDQKAEAFGGALGNGSIMRCAPVAVLLRGRTSDLIRASLDTSRITHANQICQWAAAALNLMIAYLLRGEIDGLADRVVSEVAEPSVRERLLGASSLDRDALKPGGHVLDTLESAVWAFANTKSLEDAVIVAANLGGDADTRAAVTGALAGARYGASAIPPRWLQALEGRDEIEQLADRLWALGSG